MIALLLAFGIQLPHQVETEMPAFIEKLKSITEKKEKSEGDQKPELSDKIDAKSKAFYQDNLKALKTHQKNPRKAFEETSKLAAQFCENLTSLDSSFNLTDVAECKTFYKNSHEAVMAASSDEQLALMLEIQTKTMEAFVNSTTYEEAQEKAQKLLLKTILRSAPSETKKP